MVVRLVLSLCGSSCHVAPCPLACPVAAACDSWRPGSGGMPFGAPAACGAFAELKARAGAAHAERASRPALNRFRRSAAASTPPCATPSTFRLTPTAASACTRHPLVRAAGGQGLGRPSTSPRNTWAADQMQQVACSQPTGWRTPHAHWPGCPATVCVCRAGCGLGGPFRFSSPPDRVALPGLHLLQACTVRAAAWGAC